MSETPISKSALATARVLTGIAIIFMLFDGVTHVLRVPQVTEAFATLGYPTGLAFGIGLAELACLALYAIPRTNILGAALLTAYLGGAVATNLRAQMPTFNIIFPVIIGLMIWGGIYLQDARLKEIFPVRSK